MLPAKLKALRRALSQTLPRAGRTLLEPPSARRAAETLEHARAAESDADTARLTPKEFRELYGYEPKEARRMREVAELLAYSRGGDRDRRRLDS